MKNAKESLKYNENKNKWEDTVYHLLTKEAENSSNKRKRSQDDDDVEFENSVEDNPKKQKIKRNEYYGRIPHHHLPPVKPKLLDPIFCNPNSFESITKILREIISKNTCRKWIALYTDGVPYLLIYKVIFF